LWTVLDLNTGEKGAREGRFAEQEQRIAKKAMMRDISYKTSSSEAELE
jgi:hypothetical protein